MVTVLKSSQILELLKRNSFMRISMGTNVNLFSTCEIRKTFSQFVERLFESLHSAISIISKEVVGVISTLGIKLPINHIDKLRCLIVSFLPKGRKDVLSSSELQVFYLL